jgi:hypothetical protein
MRRLIVAALAVLALTGCVVSPPAPPTEEDAQRYYNAMLEKTWVGTGLSGLMDRPRVTAAEPVPARRWTLALVDCMTEKGFVLEGFARNPDSGYRLVGAAPLLSQTASDGQLAFYMCLAANPPSEIEDQGFLSVPQLDYVYDYYLTWVVPCLAQHGWNLRSAPTREEFIELEGNWSPYTAIEVDDVGDFETSAELCGASRPPLG